MRGGSRLRAGVSAALCFMCMLSASLAASLSKEGVPWGTFPSNEWMQFTPSAPEPRKYHTVAVGEPEVGDGGSPRMFVHGGVSNYDRNKCHKDVWALDLERNTWEEISGGVRVPEEVAESSGAGMVFMGPDELPHSNGTELGALIVYGGLICADAHPMRSLYGKFPVWELRIATGEWVMRTPAAHDYIIDQLSSDIDITQVVPEEPVYRHMHTMVNLGLHQRKNPPSAPAAAAGHSVYVLGGTVELALVESQQVNVADVEIFRDLWRMDLGGEGDVYWTRLSDAPQELEAHTATGYKGLMYVHGGRNRNGTASGIKRPLAVLWVYHPAEDRWEVLRPSNITRSNHVAFWAGKVMHVMGGVFEENDIIPAFNETSNRANPHVLMEVYDPARDAWLLEEERNFVWGGDTSPQTNFGAAGGSARRSSDPVGEPSFGAVFGGTNLLENPNIGVQEDDATHLFDATVRTWSRGAGAIPGKRAAFGMASLSDGRLLAYGGWFVRETQLLHIYNDVWEFDRGTWTRLVSFNGPGMRVGHRVIAAGSRGAIVMGGVEYVGNVATSGTFKNDAWLLETDRTDPDRYHAATWTMLTGATPDSSSPEPRDQFGAAFLNDGLTLAGEAGGEGVLFVFGGIVCPYTGACIESSLRLSAQVWLLDIAARRWTRADMEGALERGEEWPEARHRHACEASGASRVVCFGGRARTTPNDPRSAVSLDDLWEFSLEGVNGAPGWRRLVPSANPGDMRPRAREDPVFLRVPGAADAFFMYGGLGAIPEPAAEGLSDLWRLDLRCAPPRWRRVYPGKAFPAEAMYDAVGGIVGNALVVYGGYIPKDGGTNIDATNDMYVWDFSRCGYTASACLDGRGLVGCSSPPFFGKARVEVVDASAQPLAGAVVTITRVGTAVVDMPASLPGPGMGVSSFPRVDMAFDTADASALVRIDGLAVGTANFTLESGNETVVEIAASRRTRVQVTVYFDNRQKTPVRGAAVSVLVKRHGSVSLVGSADASSYVSRASHSVLDDSVTNDVGRANVYLYRTDTAGSLPNITYMFRIEYDGFTLDVPGHAVKTDAAQYVTLLLMDFPAPPAPPAPPPPPPSAHIVDFVVVLPDADPSVVCCRVRGAFVDDNDLLQRYRDNVAQFSGVDLTDVSVASVAPMEDNRGMTTGAIVHTAVYFASAAADLHAGFYAALEPTPTPAGLAPAQKFSEGLEGALGSRNVAVGNAQSLELPDPTVSAAKNPGVLYTQLQVKPATATAAERSALCIQNMDIVVTNVLTGATTAAPPSWKSSLSTCSKCHIQFEGLPYGFYRVEARDERNGLTIQSTTTGIGLSLDGQETDEMAVWATLNVQCGEVRLNAVYDTCCNQDMTGGRVCLELCTAGGAPLGLRGAAGVQVFLVAQVPGEQRVVSTARSLTRECQQPEICDGLVSFTVFPQLQHWVHYHAAFPGSAVDASDLLTYSVGMLPGSPSCDAERGCQLLRAPDRVPAWGKYSPDQSVWPSLSTDRVRTLARRLLCRGLRVLHGTYGNWPPLDPITGVPQAEVMYEPGLTCALVLQPEESMLFSVITVKFNRDGMVHGDVIQVFDGSDQNANLVMVMEGPGRRGEFDELPLTAKQLMIIFKANEDNEVGTGFKLAWEWSTPGGGYWETTHLVSFTFVSVILACFVSCMWRRCLRRRIRVWLGYPENPQGDMENGLDAMQTAQMGSMGTRRGISQQLVDEMLPTHIYKVGEWEDETCCICLSEYDAGDKVRTLPCNHHYHAGCIDAWLQRDIVCPLCKKDVIARPGTPETAEAELAVLAAEGRATQEARQRSRQEENNQARDRFEDAPDTTVGIPVGAGGDAAAVAFVGVGEGAGPGPGAGADGGGDAGRGSRGSSRGSTPPPAPRPSASRTAVVPTPMRGVWGLEGQPQGNDAVEMVEMASFQLEVDPSAASVDDFPGGRGGH